MANGHWIQTYTGKKINPFEPRNEDIDILDIAHALSMLCRYTGHCKEFYSVAEHSVLVADALEKNMWDVEAVALPGLMHDAAEAYFNDIASPVKAHYSLKEYKTHEMDLLHFIFRRFALPTGEVGRVYSDVVHQFDHKVGVAEAWQVMTRPPVDWNLPEVTVDIEVKFWTPNQAKTEFLQRFCDFGGGKC